MKLHLDYELINPPLALYNHFSRLLAIGTILVLAMAATAGPHVRPVSFAPAADFPSPLGPFGVAVGDFNGDSKLDLAVTEVFGSGVNVLLGNGDGTFQSAVEFPAGVRTLWVAVGDFNNDGKPDLVTANRFSFSISVLLGNGDGTFQAPIDTPADASPQLIVGDFNRDGKLDVALAGTFTDLVSIFLGNGDGTFQATRQFAVGSQPNGLAAGDFNHDGKLDLAVANAASDNVSVLLGNGDGTFQSATNFNTGRIPVSVAVGDFNRKVKPGFFAFEPDAEVRGHQEDKPFKHPHRNLDLAVANLADNTVSVLLGNGNGTFQPRTDFAVGINPSIVVVGDFNKDRRLDLAVANQGDADVSVLLGNGDGTFQAATNLSVGNTPHSVAVGDFNRDGRQDLVAANEFSDTVSVLLNTTDVKPPVVLCAKASPEVLFPAHNQLVPVTISVVAKDDIDPAPISRIISVSSNERRHDRGGGNTSPDWVITGDLTVSLRAERTNAGSMRIYAIAIECADHSGNTATRTVLVRVSRQH